MTTCILCILVLIAFAHANAGITKLRAVPKRALNPADVVHAFELTTRVKTAGGNSFGQGFPIGYAVDGIETPEINVIAGKTYKFVVKSACNHPFYLATDSRGSGRAPMVVGFDVPPAKSNPLICAGESILWKPSEALIGKDIWYQCTIHDNMGWFVRVKAQSTTDATTSAPIPRPVPSPMSTASAMPMPAHVSPHAVPICDCVGCSVQNGVGTATWCRCCQHASNPNCTSNSCTTNNIYTKNSCMSAGWCQMVNLTTSTHCGVDWFPYDDYCNASSSAPVHSTTLPTSPTAALTGSSSPFAAINITRTSSISSTMTTIASPLMYDCFGVLHGVGRLDVCGVCDGNGRSCVDCQGVVNGTAVVDWCNVCDGDGSSCVDCAGVRNGTSARDVCGVCGGDDSTCRGCDGVPLSKYVYDPCGVCQEQRPDGGFALSCATPALENDNVLIGGVVGGIFVVLALVNCGLLALIMFRKRRAKHAAANMFCESGGSTPPSSHYDERVAVASPAAHTNYDVLEPNEVIARVYVDTMENADGTALATERESETQRRPRESETQRKVEFSYQSGVPEAEYVISSASVQATPSEASESESPSLNRRPAAASTGDAQASSTSTVKQKPKMTNKTKNGEHRHQQPTSGSSLMRKSARPAATEVLHIPIGEIEIGKRLGEGAFGVVFRGRWHGKRVAVKQVKASSIVVDSDHAIAEFEAEVSKMVTTTFHENVVQLYGVTTLENGDMAAVVEYCAKGALVDALYGDKARVDWTVAQLFAVAHGAASGVAHLHRLGVVHRDIAARNVLLAGKRDIVVKVADFGMARLLAESVYEQLTMDAVGPLKWMAPEQMERRAYSRASDVFAFGVLLFEVFAREAPWRGVSNIVTATKVMHGERMDLSSRKIPREVAPLMLDCWTANPVARPTMALVQSRLRDNAVSSDESFES